MIKREIIDMQLYDADYRYWFKSWRAWLAISILIPLGISSFIFGYWFAGIFCFIGFLIGMILLLLPEVVSQKGHRIHLHLKAFYDFLKNKDSQSMQTVFANDPNYFDKVYPYAVALNLDKSFVQKVKTFHPQGPTWYGWYGIPVMTGQRNTMEDFGKEFEPKEITTAFNSVPMPESGSFVGKFSGMFLAAKLTGTSMTQFQATSLTLIPMAGMAIGLVASTNNYLPGLATEISAMVFSMVAIFETIGPFAVMHGLRLAGEIGTDEDPKHQL